ncbi:MAG: hypothetical protein HOW73_34405 [Polyangiaceae bacterium]|nr:hypothetical protein [Polyangiaceae bacterium]
METREALAAIRIVGAVAQADGKIEAAEADALRRALADWQPKLPDGTDIHRLLAEPVDLDQELANVTSAIGRRAVFETAIAMSLADGSANAAENKVLSRIRESFSNTEASPLEQVVDGSIRRWGEATRLTPILDPEIRAKRVEELIRSKARLACFAALLPIPFVSGVLVYWIWDATVDGVGMLWGRPLTRADRIARFGGLLGIGVAGAAVHSVLHLVPLWGSIVFSAGAFAATIGIGYAANLSFQSEGKATKEELAKAYAEARSAGKKMYEAEKADLEGAAKSHQAEMTALARRFEQGEITVDEYDRELDRLMKGKS